MSFASKYSHATPLFNVRIKEPAYTSLADLFAEYYRQKTSLKGDTDPFNKLLYDKSKAVLNGLYGMMAQDPVKQDIIWTGSEFIEADDDPETKLLKHNRNAFINYAWGVWCTAWARYLLEQGIIIAGPEDFLYCDTDSVKYVSHIKIF